MILIFSSIWSGTLQTIVKLLWNCLIPKGILLLLFLCISWRDGNVKLVFCILGSPAGAWNTSLHLSKPGCLLFCGWVEQWLPHIHFCVTFLHLTGYHLPTSYCISLSLFPNLQIKFWTATGEGGESLKWCHSLCRMIQFMLFRHFLSPAIFSFACSFHHRLFWLEEEFFRVNVEQIFNPHGENTVFYQKI